MKSLSVPAFLIIPLLMIFPSVSSSTAPKKLICPKQPIKALAGDDVTLTCHLHPSMNAISETVLWTKPGLDPKYVHIYENGKLLKNYQNPSYNDRTRLPVEELMNGKVVLEIKNVKISDDGEYCCILNLMQKEASVQLSVGAVSEPFIGVSQNKSGRVALQCRCEGWYPEPEVMWLDSEGNLLTAENKDTFRGPDGLFTVSSRLTVSQRHSHSFTCRVFQERINQTKETMFYLPVDCSTQNCHCCIWCPIASIIVVIFSVALTYRLTKGTKETSFSAKERETFNHVLIETPELDQSF